MLRFGFGKKKEEEKKVPTCACRASAAAETDSAKAECTCCAQEKGDIVSVKVLGSGCPSCHALLNNTEQAVQAMGLSVKVEYITDMPKIMEYGVMSLPALVVNDKVVSVGKVLKPDDIEAFLRKVQA